MHVGYIGIGVMGCGIVKNLRKAGFPVSFVVHHDRRRVLHINVTENPTAQWVIQQLREAFPFTPSARYLIRDPSTHFARSGQAVIPSSVLR